MKLPPLPHIPVTEDDVKIAFVEDEEDPKKDDEEHLLQPHVC